MKNQITVTLAQIKEYESPCVPGWSKVFKAIGGYNADLNKRFPVSSILDSNGLDDTLWVLRCLPEYNVLCRKFAWWCAEQVKDNARDDRVSRCLEVVKRYSEGLATDEELSEAKEAALAAERSASAAVWSEPAAAAAAITTAAAAAEAAAAAAEATRAAAGSAAESAATAAQLAAEATWAVARAAAEASWLARAVRAAEAAAAAAAAAAAEAAEAWLAEAEDAAAAAEDAATFAADAAAAAAEAEAEAKRVAARAAVRAAQKIKLREVLDSGTWRD